MDGTESVSVVVTKLYYNEPAVLSPSNFNISLSGLRAAEIRRMDRLDPVERFPGQGALGEGGKRFLQMR